MPYTDPGPASAPDYLALNFSMSERDNHIAMRNRLAVRRSLSSQLGQIGIVLTLSVVVRLMLFMNFPVALTADSWDYLSAAGGLYHHADFNSYAMRDLRLPAYPVFLAATYPLTEMRAD